MKGRWGVGLGALSLAACAACSLALLGGAAGVTAATGVTYTVDSSADGSDADTTDGVCAVAGGGCTLRAAIEQANAHAGADTIAFNLGASGVQTISPGTALPSISDAVTIDGTTEPGFADRPLVELSGASISGGADGLTITAGNSTVRGLIVNRFQGWQIHLSTAGSDVVAGNFVATNADGSLYAAATGNYDGIFVDNVPSVRIGGTTGTTPGGACTGDCNLITPGYPAVGHGIGIQIKGSGADGTLLQGNMIGLRRGGSGGLTGALDGVFISGAPNTTIGGGTPAARNTIGNAAFDGVLAQNASNVQIQGNFFGTESSGTVAAPTTQANIRLVDSPGSAIGGPALVTGQAPGNLISGSPTNGVDITTAGVLGASVSTTVQGNLIGTNAAGTAALGNQTGVQVTAVQGVTIGGTTASTRNVVSGNSFAGIVLSSAYNDTVSGNYVGTDIAGAAGVGNGVGIFLYGFHTAGTFSTIGGTTLGSANVISGSIGTSGTGAGDGIVSNDGSVEDHVLGNLIGTTASGTGSLPNAANGIETFSGSRLQIGGTSGTSPNTIAHNGGAGVKSHNGGPLVLGNSIVANGGLGIDNTSPASGMPTLQVTTIGPGSPSGSRIQGTLTGVFAGNDYTVQLYANSSCDPSGAGEGEVFLGTTVVHAAADGTAAVDFTSPTAVVAGQAVTGTVTLQNATQGLLTTSNFSACKLAGSADLGVTLTDAPDPVDQGQTLTYTSVITNNGPDGAQFVQAAYTFSQDASFASASTTVGSCTGVRGSAQCNIGSLASGASATVTIQILPSLTGAYAASAQVSSAMDDPAAGNNSAATTTTVQAAPLAAVTYTVNSTGDGADANTADGTCADSTGACTLRAAIQQANIHPSTDTIAFDLGSSGVQTIAPATALPAITDPVVIDGTTEPGYVDRPLVELSGANLGSGDGLAISAGGSTVRGLTINRFSGWQIHLTSLGGDVIAGNFVGASNDGSIYAQLTGNFDGIFVDGVPNVRIGGTTGTTPGGACTGDCNLVLLGYPAVGHGIGVQIKGAGATGTTIQGNVIGLARNGSGGFPFGNVGAQTGVYITNASDTTIGGATAAARNTIGNIAFYGVRGDNAANTVITGNYLGTNTAGTAAEPVTHVDVLLRDSAGGQIGGPTLIPGQGLGNVISGASTFGVMLSTASISPDVSTTVQGNLIGTNAAGTAALGNASSGISVQGVAGVTIGGTTAQARNVVSGNGYDGIELLGNTASTTVAGNYIGTDVTGSTAIPNQRGIVLSGDHPSPVTIGGTTLGSANVVSGQSGGSGSGAGDGIVLLTGNSDDHITGNLIGTTASGTAALPNAGSGIHAVGGVHVTVDGGNTIAHNGGAGIKTDHGPLIVLGNSIADNGGLGIDNSGDTGPVAHVTAISATGSGGTRVQGTLTGVFAGNDYTVQAYGNSACDSSGFGEGETFLGSVVAHAATDGTTAFDVSSTTPYVAGHGFTVTVTLQNPFQGLIGTLEFSACKLSGSADLSAALTDAPDPVDQGQTLSYTGVVTNAGPDPSPFAVADFTLPSDATFLGVTTTQGTCTGARGSAHCTLGALASGATATVVVRIAPLTAGTASASVAVSSAVDDPNTANNSASTTTTVSPATIVPATFTVNDQGDAADATLGDGTCATAGGVCTLRAAIQEANVHPGTDTIAFDLAGAGVQTIAPASALPEISDPVVIDGTTQPGFTDRPLVQLDGSALAAPNDGLVISAGGSTVRGLVINRFSGWQIHLTSNGGDVIAGNFVGAKSDGSIYEAGSYDGIFVDGVPNVQIGGTTGTTPGGACTGDCNLVTIGYPSGHGVGIQVKGAGATGTTIEGNVIGLARNGSGGFPFGNVGAATGVYITAASNTTIGGATDAARNTFGNIGFYGVRADNAPGTTITGNFFGTNTAGDAAEQITGADIRLADSPGSVVGGPTLTTGRGLGNVISGGLSYGLILWTAGISTDVSTTVQGNLVGTNAAGTAALGNTNAGISLQGVTGVTIGGTTAQARNVISGNGVAGISLIATGSNTIAGNYIGTDVTGVAAIGNSIGIRISQSQVVNTIGGSVPGAANVISGQVGGGAWAGAGDGIANVDGSTAIDVIQGNLIGTTASGTAALGNAANGVDDVNGSRLRIGTANTIAHNGGDGIAAPRGGAIVLGNSIHDNGGLGISTPGAGQPTLTIAGVQIAGGSTQVQGSLAGGLAANVYTIQLYANASCDSTGFGEGQSFLGSFDVTADSSGAASFTQSFATDVSATPQVTGTITLQNTAQGLISTLGFSACTAAPVVTPDVTAPPNVTKGTGPGSTSASTTVTDAELGTATTTTGGATITRSGVPVGNSFPVGTTTITWTATTPAGVTASATQLVTVVDDTPPLVTAPGDITREPDTGFTTATIDVGTATASDNVGVVSLTGTRSDSLALGAPYPTGTTTITWRATDAAGNSATALQHVTVHDTTPPVIVAPADADVPTDAGSAFATVDPGVPVVTDNVPGVTYSGLRSDALALSAPYPLGTTTITWTATDAAGNTASAVQHVLVRDLEPPAITCPADRSVSTDPGAAAAAVSVGSASATDNVLGVSVTAARSDSLAPSAPYPLGTTTITWTATDAAGNTATCTQSVSVADTEPPVVTPPADVTQPTDPGSATATLDPGTATASDNVGVAAVGGTRSDGAPLSAPYPLGTTTITWTATDAAGNAGTATQHVTVVDGEPPVVHVPADISTSAAPGATAAAVTYAAPTATDNAPGVGPVVCDHPSGSDFPLGATLVTCTALDAAGNSGSASFTVTVDAPPVIDAITISPTDPHTNDVLTGLVAAHDHEGDAITFTYAWFRNGVQIAGETGSTLDLSAAGNGDRGDTITLRVVPNDGKADGASFTSAPMTVVDSAPVVASIAIDKAAPKTNDVLTASATATDADGDPVALAYQWFRNGSPIAGATAATLDLGVAGNGDRGDTIRVRVTPSDGTLAGVPADSTTVTIADTAPTLALSTSSLSGQYSDAVGPVTATANDPDGDPLTFSATGLPGAVALTTGGGGTASVGGVLDVAAGSYAATVRVSDGTATASAPLTVTVSPENATIAYTGGTFVAAASATATSASVPLSALVTQAADGSPGDLTKAGVSFLLFRSTNTTTSPDLTVGPIAVAAGGTAATTASVPLGQWRVVARLVGRGFFAAPDAPSTALVVYAPTPDRFVTGAGLVTDAGRPANFGLEVRLRKDLTPDGEFFYSWTGDDGRLYSLRATGWQGGFLAFVGAAQNTAVFGGQAVVFAIDRSGAAGPAPGGAFTYRVTATDNGEPGRNDTFSIEVYGPGGALVHASGTMGLRAGNIAVHGRGGESERDR